MAGAKSCCPREAFRQNVCVWIQRVVCEAERPSAGGREIQLCLKDEKIYSGDSDHPRFLSHCISTRDFFVEAVINWTLEANKKDELPCTYLNKQVQAEE